MKKYGFFPHFSLSLSITLMHILQNPIVTRVLTMQSTIRFCSRSSSSNFLKINFNFLEKTHGDLWTLKKKNQSTVCTDQQFLVQDLQLFFRVCLCNVYTNKNAIHFVCLPNCLQHIFRLLHHTQPHKHIWIQCSIECSSNWNSKYKTDFPMNIIVTRSPMMN